jgi:transposase
MDGCPWRTLRDDRSTDIDEHGVQQFFDQSGLSPRACCPGGPALHPRRV